MQVASLHTQCLAKGCRLLSTELGCLEPCPWTHIAGPVAISFFFSPASRYFMPPRGLNPTWRITIKSSIPYVESMFYYLRKQ